MNNNYLRHKKRQHKQLVSVISIFLLGREELRNVFWNIVSVDLDNRTQKLKVGVTGLDGNLGTMLEKLRKTSKELAAYLYDTDVTFRKVQIVFYVDNSSQEELKLNNKLEEIEQQIANKQN